MGDIREQVKEYVCGNFCSYVQDTRFDKYFTVYGDRSIHFGPYEGCGNAPPLG